MNWSLIEEHEYTIAPGVVLLKSIVESEPLKETVQRIQFDSGQPFIQWFPASSGGKVEKLETVRNLMSDACCSQNNIIASVNGDFFSYAGVPSGLQIVNREIITSPFMTKVLMAQLLNGRTRLEEQVTLCAYLRDKQGRTLRLDAINRPRPNTPSGAAVLYNDRFGRSTLTSDGGIEVVIDIGCSSGKFIMGQPNQGTVLTVEEAADSAIRPGFLTLSATGDKAEWIRHHLQSGTELTFTLEFDKGISEASQVISGNSTLAYVLLRNGEVEPSILDPKVEHNHHRHPRTIAAVQGNQINLFVIDGRQPGYSDGMTMAESARYLQSLHMDYAINLDGGGSTTCFARLPGEEYPVLVNSPSDGMERAVGNAIVIANQAPRGGIEQLLLYPQSPAVLLANSQMSFTVKAVDSNLHPVPVPVGEVEWTASESIGSISQSGLLTVGSQSGEGYMECRVGEKIARVAVSVTNTISSLRLKPEHSVVDRGGSLQLTITAKDSQGDDIICSPDAFEWEVEESLGSVDGEGLFTAGDQYTRGIIQARYRNQTASAAIQIGKRHKILADFEQIDDISVTSEGAVPGSVRVKKTARPNPVRWGTFSGRLSYDFTDTFGHSRASIHFLNRQGEIGILVEGKPIRIALWVYGDANNHWLRLGIKDKYGQAISLNLTERGALDWEDWKYIVAEIPEHIAYPVTVCHISLVEYNDANKNKGAIFFDQLRAEYMDHQEDVSGPIFSDFSPAPGQLVHGSTHWGVTVSARVADEDSGVDPASITMWVNGNIVEAEYAADTGLISWKPPRQLPAGEYSITIYAKDRQGNPSVPKANWSFVLQNQFYIE